MFRSVDTQIDTEICILSICFICNFYTFLFVALTSMGENEDIEENDSDSDGEVMNMASDLMCSTPPVASPMTLLFFVFVHFYSEDVYSYERTWKTSEGKESK